MSTKGIEKVRRTKIFYLGLILVVLILLYLFMPKELFMSPLMTPEGYLGSKPSIMLFDKWVLLVPSSTLIVYALGIQIIVLGILLIKQEKKTWGTSLVFWGIGTILAGTSYQGLGYELKCAGLDHCLFTSWFELAYLFMTAISIALMGFAFTTDFMNQGSATLVKRILKVALVTYTIVLVMGSYLNIRFLVSYELFTIFWMPFFGLFFIQNVINYRKTHALIDYLFIVLWLLFLGVNVAYYVYYLFGLTSSFYEWSGLWLSDNDILHVGLILWFLYFQVKIKDQLK